jgi:hypothetical protein
VNEFPTRRELRAAEQLAGSAAQAFDAPYRPAVDQQPVEGTRRSIRHAERNPVPTLASNPNMPFVDEDAPKTSEIVITAADNAPTFSIVLGSGSEPKTGSIQLPILNPETGELAVVKTARESDEAMNLSSAEGFVSNVQPVSANAWMIEVDSLNLVPQATNNLFRQMHIAVLSSVILVGVGGLLLAAYMLGIFN